MLCIAGFSSQVCCEGMYDLGIFKNKDKIKNEFKKTKQYLFDNDKTAQVYECRYKKNITLNKKFKFMDSNYILIKCSANEYMLVSLDDIDGINNIHFLDDLLGSNDEDAELRCFRVDLNKFTCITDDFDDYTIRTLRKLIK